MLRNQTLAKNPRIAQSLDALRRRYLEAKFLVSLGTELRVRSRRTTLHFYAEGLGDGMIARQFGAAFLEFCRERDDPKLGNLVVAGGKKPPAFLAPRGDVNAYWWWSMGGRDDWLDYYLSQARTKPDVILCPSRETVEFAESRGLPALLLPLGVGSAFRPLGIKRRGVGYAGTRQHKDPEQEATIIEPVETHFPLEWVETIRQPQDLNAWYNTKAVALGMTERTQERWGMVNNRVFEALASGTPFVLHRHPSLEETLGHPYPYQSSTPEETLRWVSDILEHHDSYLTEFHDRSRHVREKHSYQERVNSLFEFLPEFL